MAKVVRQKSGPPPQLHCCQYTFPDGHKLVEILYLYIGRSAVAISLLLYVVHGECIGGNSFYLQRHAQCN